MPYKNESMLMGGDASADTSTELCFNPPEGPFDASNVVTGNIGAGDEDWIAIKLTEGNTYTITTGGGDASMMQLNDSVLKLMDSKGGLISMNDDTDGAKGKLDSTLKFTPEAGSGTQVYFISVSGYTGNPGAMNIGTYTVSVKEVAVLPAGEGADIEGSANADKLTGTDASESIAGLGGHDSLFGGGGDDSLSGGAGNDLLWGGKGGDTLKGGAGTDTISYEGSAMGVTINLNDGTASGGDAEGDVLGEMLEHVIGSDYDDTITGTDDATNGNSLWGGGGDDTLSGRDGPDMLDGGAGDDTLIGGDEGDTLKGGPGADTLTGGRGEDTASYAGSAMGVTVRLHASQAMGGDAEGDTWGDTVTAEYTMPAEDPEDPEIEMTETVPDIINLTGSGMADILAGDSRGNEISGGGGDDKLYGGPGGGDDELKGEGGNDMLFGGKGDDTLNGGMGNDVLNGGAGADEFDGGAGNDMIYADLGDIGKIDGGSNPEGQPGDMDTVSFARLVDMAVGASGAAFTLGTDAVNIERVIGTDEDDYITGADESTDDAGDAPEEIEGGDGGDVLVGGDGSGDTVSYENSDRRVRVDLGDGTDDDGTGSSNSGGHATGDTISGFENIKGSAYGDVLEALTGSSGTPGSTLWGLGGDDSLVGGLGNDTIEGGAGADELDGGVAISTEDGEVGRNTQVNTLSYAGSDAGVTVNLASVSVSGGHAEGDDIETYEFTLNAGGEDETEIDVATFLNVTGSAHGDRLTGDRFGNHLVGGEGDDTLRGGAGPDVLEGNKGADSLDGGQDRGDMQSEDWAAYRGASAGVTVNLNTGDGTAGEAMGDTLKNIELIWGSMSTGSGDTFIASEDPDIIHGDGGSDTVSYEASKHGVNVTLPTVDDTGDGIQWTEAAVGADGTLGTSDDVPAMFNPATEANLMAWRGGSLGTIDERTVEGSSYLVQADDENTATKSYAEGDILASIENITGSRQNDVIVGDAVPNIIKGGAGHDRISGGDKNDKLHGGDGNDVIGARTDEDLNGDEDTLDPGELGVTEAGDDMMYGDAGNDTISGGTGNDTLNGGAGDDDLTGGTGIDTFVFGPGDGSDVIIGIELTPTAATETANRTGDGDYIDLTAFGISPDDVEGLLSERAGNVVVNLEDYGGGRITIQDQTITGLTATLGIELVLNDMNGAEAGIGTGVGATDGIFIV